MNLLVDNVSSDKLAFAELLFNGDSALLFELPALLFLGSLQSLHLRLHIGECLVLKQAAVVQLVLLLAVVQ